jgi:broad specificity phosphatase PhoE
MMDVMDIYIIRHVATAHNMKGVYMGRVLDSPCDKEALKMFSRNISASFSVELSSDIALFSSPLFRCVNTAEAIKSVVPSISSITEVDALIEADMGGFTGKTVREIALAYPSEFDLWVNTPSEFTFPGGESFVQIQNRVYNFLEELRETSELSAVILVTHADVIKMLISRILGIALDKKKYFCIDNGSVTHVDYYSGAYRLKFMNWLPHE